jgi:hypothetical protein
VEHVLRVVSVTTEPSCERQVIRQQFVRVSAGQQARRLRGFIGVEQTDRNVQMACGRRREDLAGDTRVSRPAVC